MRLRGDSKAWLNNESYRMKSVARMFYKKAETRLMQDGFLLKWGMMIFTLLP